MTIRKKKKELLRLAKGFEEEASKYHALELSIIYISEGWVNAEEKLVEANYAVPLWQYYGKIESDETIRELLTNIKQYDPMTGVPGAKFYAFGVLEGERIDLFLRMAKRAGNIFSEKEINKIKDLKVSEIADSDRSEGKPVYVSNGNPLAVWLNYVLYHSSISHPMQFDKTVVNIDPFSESLKAIDGLLESGTLERGKNPLSNIEDIQFKVALSFPGEKRSYVSEVARILTDNMGKDCVFYDEYYQAQLARPNLDTLLQNIYKNNSDLIVVFLCEEYSEKEWCGLEWRAVREIIKTKNDNKIMFIRFDNVDIDGVFSIDGYIDANKHSEIKTAEYVMERQRLLDANIA